MRPKDLKFPYTFDTRHPFFCEESRILYVPDHYDLSKNLIHPLWYGKGAFPLSNPICIEYCSGNGAWIIEKAKKERSFNWVAIEKKFERARKIWSKMKNENLENLIIICGEGYKATKFFFPSQSIHSVFVNFPDPWPKKKHAKHRIIQKPFLTELNRVLINGGEVKLVTDDINYSEEMAELFISHEKFSPVFPSPYFVTSIEDYGSSYFHDLWVSKNKSIRYLGFSKK